MQHVLSLISNVMRSFFFSNFEPGLATLMQKYATAKIIFNEEIKLINTNYPELGNMSVIEIYFSFLKYLNSANIAL